MHTLTSANIFENCTCHQGWNDGKMADHLMDKRKEYFSGAKMKTKEEEKRYANAINLVAINALLIQIRFASANEKARMQVRRESVWAATNKNRIENVWKAFTAVSRCEKVKSHGKTWIFFPRWFSEWQKKKKTLKAIVFFQSFFLSLVQALFIENCRFSCSHKRRQRRQRAKMSRSFLQNCAQCSFGWMHEHQLKTSRKKKLRKKTASKSRWFRLRNFFYSKLIVLWVSFFFHSLFRSCFRFSSSPSCFRKFNFFIRSHFVGTFLVAFFFTQNLLRQCKMQRRQLSVPPVHIENFQLKKRYEIR